MNKWGFHILVSLALVAPCHGCRSTQTQGTSLSIPSSVVFPALCTAFFRDEEFDSSTTTTVVSETRPLFRMFALRSLHGAGEMTPAEAELDDARDEALEARFRSIRIGVPAQDGSCRWLLADRPTEEYYGSDELLLEVSEIVEDPFAKAESAPVGLFVRLSIGGASGASWYWVGLKLADDAWKVTSVSRLPISDG